MGDDEDLRQVWRLLMKGIVCVLIMGLFAGGCCWFNSKAGLPNDHVGEAFAERLIESHFGLDHGSFDLTPED